MNAEEIRGQLLNETMTRTLQNMEKQATRQELADVDTQSAAKIAKLAYAKGQEDMAKLAYQLGVQDATVALLQKLAMEGGDTTDAGPTTPAYNQNKDHMLETRLGLEELAATTPQGARINKNDDIMNASAGGGPSAPAEGGGMEQTASIREAEAMLDELLKEAMEEEAAAGGAASGEGQGIPGPAPTAPMPETQADSAENAEPPGRTRTAPRQSEATFASYIQAMTAGGPEAS